MTFSIPASVRGTPALAAAAALVALAAAPPAPAAPIISEFLAAPDLDAYLLDPSGSDQLVDEDGQPNDWIEISNPDGSPVSLDGWFLTDSATNLMKWRIPAVTVPAGGAIVVFASGKDRSDPGGELHTNFELTKAGEFLALVEPDGTTLATEFAPAYPPQYAGVSYGRGTGGAIERLTFVGAGAPSRYHIPTDDSLGASWRDAPDAFDDSSWAQGVGGLGFESGSPPDGIWPIIGTDISEAMKLVNASAFIRFPFDFDATDRQVQSLILKVKVDDGFVAWLNGVEIARDLAPDTVAFDSRATGSRSDTEVVADPLPADPNVTSFQHALRDGGNVLAIQGMNTSPTASDFGIAAELVADVLDTSGGSQLGFFAEPTPGTPNSVVSTPPPAEIVFSRSTGTFTDTFQLELTCATPGAVIRYTTDRSVPTDDIDNPSEEYTGPITVDATTQVRARAFLPGALPGPSRAETFLKASGGVPAFSSNLPIVVVSTFGRPVPDSGSTSRQEGFVAFYEPDPATGRTTVTGAPQAFSRMGVRKRGSSSSSWPKYQMSIETWEDDTTDLDGDGRITVDDERDHNIEPLGLPSEADWILSSKYQFDRALMRNDFIYELSRQMGRYAVRTRFVEVYLDTNGRDLDDADYWGIYSVMERIEADPNRVDVPSIRPWENSEPEITGGYVFKKDRGDPGEPTFSVGGMGTMVHVDPDGLQITRDQRNWLVGRLNAMNDALNRPDGINPSTGLHFSDYLDVDAWIDHLWLNTLTVNVDWGRLSAYYSLDRGGKVVAGPIWDFDRSMGSEDGRDANPRAWSHPTDSRTWYDGGYPWFGRLMGFSRELSTTQLENPAAYTTRPDIFQRVVDRWHQLRRKEFSTENINAVIDSMAAEVAEAQVRNFAKWTAVRPNGGSYDPDRLGGWEGEVAHLKGWLLARVEWIDDQFPELPAFNTAGGPIDPGFGIVMSVQADPPVDPPPVVFYTTDGTDPRAFDGSGNPSPTARQFAGGATDETFLDATSAGSLLVIPDDGSAASEALAAQVGYAWTNTGFDDDTWTSITGGVGFESGDPPTGIWPIIATDIGDEMRLQNASAFVRYPFTFTNDTANINSVTLQVQEDDAFVVWLNGERVADSNAESNNVPDPLEWNSEATSPGRGDADVATTPLTFDLTPRKGLIRQGADNVIAVQFLNSSKVGSDAGVAVQLDINHTVTANALELSESTLITARTRIFDRELNWYGWSAPTEAYFIVGEDPASADNLVISEVHYHPLPPTAEEAAAGFGDQDDFEFLEILNIGSQPVNLFESSFTAGFDFDFRDGDIVSLPPGSRAVIVSNRAAFERRHGPGLPIAGEYPNDRLSNNGETIRLRDRLQLPIREFRYEDDAPWPAAADGTGVSLVLVNPTSNPDHALPTSWAAGSVIHGTPGTGEPDGSAFTAWLAANGLSGPLSDKDGDGVVEIVEWSMGLDPDDPASNLASTVYTAGRESFTVGGETAEYLTLAFTLRDDLGGVAAITERSSGLDTWTPALGDLVLLSSSSNGDGTTTFLYRTRDPAQPGTDSFFRLRFTAP